MPACRQLLVPLPAQTFLPQEQHAWDPHEALPIRLWPPAVPIETSKHAMHAAEQPQRLCQLLEPTAYGPDLPGTLDKWADCAVDMAQNSHQNRLCGFFGLRQQVSMWESVALPLSRMSLDLDQSVCAFWSAYFDQLFWAR